MTAVASEHGSALARPIAQGFIAIAATFGVLGSISATIPISGAVVSPGRVIVESGVKPVQNAEGGIVSEIKVGEGDNVVEGQLLIKLDDTQVRAKLSVVREQLVKLYAVHARLVAERDDKADVTFPTSLTESQSAAAAAELKLYEARKRLLNLEKSILTQRVVQNELLIDGNRAELAAVEQTHGIAVLEYTGLKPLSDVGTVPVTRTFALGREIAGLLGRKGQLQADIARTGDLIAEIRFQIAKADADFITQLTREISDVEAQIRENLEKQKIAEESLARTEILAPQAGSVQDLKVFAAQAVVRPSEPVLYLIPSSGRLIVEGRVSPTQIDQVKVGQSGFIRLTNFNKRVTPELLTKVIFVSSDLTAQGTGFSGSADSSMGQSRSATAAGSFYAIRMEILDHELNKLDGGKLVPGMVVDTMVTTDDRTVLSYLLKPLLDRLATSLRER
jgi:HlyD family secretion protein